MNSADFWIWCQRRGFRSPERAAAALGLPKAQLCSVDAGDGDVSARLELACIGYEYCDEHDPPESELAAHYASMQRRIRRFLELEPGPRDEELATALVLGLASVVGLEKGDSGKKELLDRAHDLISRSLEWSQIANKPEQTILKFAETEHQQQTKETKTFPETILLRRDREKDNRTSGAADRLIGELLLLSPTRTRIRGESRFTRRASNHPGGAAVIAWRSRPCDYVRPGTPKGRASLISPIDHEMRTSGTARPITPRDWRWSICLACDALQHATAEQGGIFLITCEARTLLAERLAMRLRAAHGSVAFDRRSRASLEGPLAALSTELDIKSDPRNRATWLQTLAETLERRRSVAPVLIIDTADLLDDPAIRELAPLLDVGGDGAKIRAVLVGRPELQARLEQPDLAAVNGRVCFRHRLEPLNDTDVRSFMAGRIPHDFAIGNVAGESLAVVGDFIRTNPERVASLWPRARLLASQNEERSPSLEYVVKAVQMLGGDAGGFGTAAAAHGDARLGTSAAAQRVSQDAGRKSLPRAVAHAATVAIIVVVWSAIPSFVGRDHTALQIAALEQVSPQPVSNLGTDSDVHAPAPTLQTAMVSDPSHDHGDKDATTVPLRPVPRSQAPPALAESRPTADDHIQRRTQGNDREVHRAAPKVRRPGNRRPVTQSIKPPHPEHPVQTTVQTNPQPQTQTAPGPTAPRQPARVDSQVAVASEPECRPYVSDADFSGRQVHVAGLACHDASGRWWLMSQQRETE